MSIMGRVGGLMAISLACLAGCASQGADVSSEVVSPLADSQGTMAVASLGPTQGSAVTGLVMFSERDGHLMVHAKVSGLRSNAEHGFHIHERGECASTDGSSAGGHFNPEGKPHGPQGGPRHAGDMPNLRSDGNGVADQKFKLSGVTLSAGPTSIKGRSVIVHFGPDDYKTQPTGNSGARIACGVIAVH